MESLHKNISPNAKQRTAIEHPPAPLMIIAGAGTGKTFTIENRITHLIQHFRVDPQHILTITYTEKAAKELQDRVVSGIGNAGHKMAIFTFHSLCYKILTDYSKENVNLLQESEAIHLFIQNFDDLAPFQSDEFPLNPQKAITDSFIPFFNRMRDELIDPKEISKDIQASDGLPNEELANQLSDLIRIYPYFQSWKKNLNVVDYGDIIFSTYKILSTDKSILKKVQDQYRHIIVDEFQDNNFALNEIISLIVGERNHVTVVGDDDQVIYSFRGASSYNIKAFKQRYGTHNDYMSISLEDNYRSNQAILDLANSSIRNNADRVDKELFSAINLPQIKPRIYWGNSDEQMHFLINEIRKCAEGGSSFSDIAVLCRTRSQVNKVTHALKIASIPVATQYMSLLNCSVVKDIMAWCQVISRGTYQDSAIFRIFQTQFGYEVTHNIFKKCKNGGGKSRFDMICEDKSIQMAYPRIKNTLKQINMLMSITQKRSAGEMVWEIAEYLGVLKIYAKDYTLDDHYILLNVGDFLKRSQNFSTRNKDNGSIKAFNNFLEVLLQTSGLPSIQPTAYRKQDAVIVNTIHSAKGAEYPVVFLPFLRSASFPLNFKTSKKMNRPPERWLKYKEVLSQITPKEHHLSEERRLFYVAITRAKRKLYILAPDKATSPFIKELREDLMEEKKMSATEQDIRTYSELKMKYENKLQKAVAREDYTLASNLGNALKIIHEHEQDNIIKLGDSDWEKALAKELENEFEPDIPDKIYLSASAIDTYESCPMKYRLGRIDGIPQTAKKPELIFGSIIHNVLQRFHEPDKPLTKKRILHLLDQEWKKDDFDYSVREKMFKEQGIEILERYCDNLQDSPPDVVMREKEFVFDLDSVSIRGAIDRIDLGENGITILDYKTSKNPTSAKSNLQLAIYSMYLEQLNDEKIGGIPSLSSLYFLREKDKPLKSHAFTKDEIDNTKDKILKVADKIRKKVFKAKTGKHCDWCDYKHLVCPEWEN